MNRLSYRHGAAGLTADDGMWAGLDRSEDHLVTEDDLPSNRRTLAILLVYGAILCLGVITLVA